MLQLLYVIYVILLQFYSFNYFYLFLGKDRRLQFNEIMLNKIEENPIILDNIMWSDKASFKLFGHINRHNCVYRNGEHAFNITITAKSSWCQCLGWYFKFWCFKTIFLDGMVTKD